MDCIRLTGIRSYGYTGVLPEEQVLGQWFEVDVALWLDLSQPGRSDRLEDTLDYREVIVAVQQLIKTAQLNLLECLATAIADHLLDYPVDQVQVRLTKVAAAIPDFAGQVTVELTRRH